MLFALLLHESTTRSRLKESARQHAESRI